MKNVQTNFCRMLQFALLMGLSLFGLAAGAQAQACSANMDFSDPASTRYVSGGSGSIAFRGSLNGDVYGRVRNGKLTDFDVNLDPDVNGPNGLRRLYINYNASSSTAVPAFRCAAISGGGVRITLTRVPTARQYFQNDGTYSSGFADVEITFERTGPGRVIVRYQHSAFNRADSTPPRPFNGTIANAVPQAGKRLTITNR
ncbi:MAG TPA: hypothetical protein VGB07_29365 [Blastocatellia bacterium]